MTGKTELLDAAWESYILARRDWWDNPNDDTRKEYDSTWDVVLTAYDVVYYSPQSERKVK